MDPLFLEAVIIKPVENTKIFTVLFEIACNEPYSRKKIKNF